MNVVDHVLSELADGLERLYGERLRRLVLYGSWARGDATSNSDVDVLVVLDGAVQPGREIDRTLELVTELSWKHSLLLSIVPVSAEDFAQVDSPLLINARREGRLVWAKSNR